MAPAVSLSVVDHGDHEDGGGPGADVTDAVGHRDVAGNVVSSLMKYVRRAAGDEGAERTIALAGLPLRAKDLVDEARWYSREEVVRLADAASQVTGDCDVGRRAGEELMRTTQASGVVSFLVAAGSPADALESAIRFGTKMAEGRPLAFSKVSDDEVVVTGRYVGLGPHPFFCGFGPGFWSQVPALFGAAGTVVETECCRRGDPACVYRIRWIGAVETPEAEILEEQQSAEALIGAFERLQRTATELAQADSLDDVLDRIVAAADRALVAPRFVAAVRVDDGRIVAAGRGLRPLEALECAQALFADPTDTTFGSAVIAPLVAKHGEYGLLAALLPEDARPGWIDERLLSAYAGHASAVLDAVVARQLAERNDAISRGLLELAQRLAAVTTPSDVCSRVVEAAPGMLECSYASVWRWDARRRVLDLAAHVGGEIEHTRLTEAEVNGLDGLDEGRTQVLIDLDTVRAPKLADDMRRAGIVQAAVAPVSARGTFLGLIAAGFETRRGADEDFTKRLHGLADLAATALDNALLVERMRHESLHDSLTGLPNRPLIEDRVHQAIRQARRSDTTLSLMFIDLDRFKNVNDTLGHRAGDDLIRKAASRLLGAVRAEDTLARMGGDEFVLLLPRADEEAASRVADKIVQAFRDPFEVGGRQLYISCSIGIALWPYHGSDYEHLLLHADAAMYEAKARGRNTYAVHSEPTTRRRELLDLENRLHTAIQQDELCVLYQPQVDLATDRVVSVEALVRWDHPDLGRLTPDRFLHLAEESGVVARIDQWVRQHALAQARQWADAGIPLRLALNMSTADLRRPELPDELACAIDAAGVERRLVEIEITDRVALGEEDLRPTLDDLASIGVRLAVDDFGVGSSVLGRLQHGPFDTLKIDRSLISQVDSDPRQAAILQALVRMCQELGLEVVAEGVETEAQTDVVRRLGCELAQGYWFSKPVAAAAIDEMIGLATATGARPGR
ncbi:MAG TPA: EAL domain-containing protein [Acidimicrobiales bacterium]|nr:EAL domain-containing protein [Acidimicrobiales bacterium]